MSGNGHFPILSPEEAVAYIQDNATIAFSGFANAGAAKAVPRALAARAREFHDRGEPFRVRVLTGSSSGNDIDEELAAVNAISWRAPYQDSPALRAQINRQEVEYVDMHLSNAPSTLMSGFFGKLNYAVVEATEVTRDGRVYLPSAIGATPTYLSCAERVIIEINRSHSMRLPEMSDIVLMPPPPHRKPIPIHDPLTKIGFPYAEVDPRKIVGIIENDEPDEIRCFPPPTPQMEKIAGHVVKFLFGEMIAGRIPKEFLPLQAGIGNMANSVMAALGKNPYIPPFQMYSIVIQDSLIDLIEQGKLTGISATSLSVSSQILQRVYENMDFFISRIVLRPQEISNNSGVLRRLGVIAMNAALEVDIYGNANASHIFGTDIVHGIGGSGEFTRNSYLSIVMCPSVTKGGRISCVVPMCPHIDSNEHSVQVVVTDQGLADLRGLGPMQRAKVIINNCAHPAYRDYLNRYIENSRIGHIRHDLKKAYELHRNLMQTGAMLPDFDPRMFA